MKISVQEYLNRATDFATKGGAVTTRYFRRNISVDYKSDHTPVTRADREAEQVMRDLIIQHYPEHGIVGEELGRRNPESRFQWVIDPIDGTLSYIHGIPLYTTLLALVYEGEPLVGVIYAPATGELCVAGAGQGTWLNGSKCAARSIKNLSEATVLTTDYRDVIRQGFQENFDVLMKKAYITRSWGDAYGHMMVACGRADLMFDPVLNIWDAAALMPVVTEAGGSFTDIYGRRIINGGSAISCSGSLFKEIEPLLIRPLNETS